MIMSSPIVQLFFSESERIFSRQRLPRTTSQHSELFSPSPSAPWKEPSTLRRSLRNGGKVLRGFLRFSTLSLTLSRPQTPRTSPQKASHFSHGASQASSIYHEYERCSANARRERRSSCTRKWKIIILLCSAVGPIAPRWCLWSSPEFLCAECVDCWPDGTSLPSLPCPHLTTVRFSSESWAIATLIFCTNLRRFSLRSHFASLCCLFLIKFVSRRRTSYPDSIKALRVKSQKSSPSNDSIGGVRKFGLFLLLLCAHENLNYENFACMSISVAYISGGGQE